MGESIVEVAQRIADEALFPSAIATDAADVVPLPLLDELAAAGLYGLVGPREYGGLAAPFPDACNVVEALASGCLTTTFVWAQHLSPVYLLTSTENTPLRDEWLRALCTGERRAGIALSAFRPDRPHVRATRVDGGWQFDGTAPWATGWGRNDVLLTSALSDDAQVVRALVDAREAPTLRPRRLTLVAANASSTVELEFARHIVPDERVVTLTPHVVPPSYDGGGRMNGSLSLGVARRCCMLIGPSALDDELVARRDQLNAANEEAMAEARAAATELAVRASAAAIVKNGSGSLLTSHHEQRLAREALFLLAFGTRPAIRDGLLSRFIH